MYLQVCTERNVMEMLVEIIKAIGQMVFNISDLTMKMIFKVNHSLVSLFSS